MWRALGASDLVGQFLEGVAEQIVGDRGGVEELAELGPFQLFATKIQDDRSNGDACDDSDQHELLHTTPGEQQRTTDSVRWNDNCNITLGPTKMNPNE